MRENFADGLGRGADLPDLPVPVDLFGRENVFDEEHLVRLHTPGEVDRIDAAQVGVNIVQELGSETDLGTHEFENLRNVLNIHAPHRSQILIAALGPVPLSGRKEAASAVSAFAELDADMPESNVNRFLHAGHRGFLSRPPLRGHSRLPRHEFYPPRSS